MQVAGWAPSTEAPSPDSDSVGLEQDLRVCISNQFSGNVDAANVGTTL